jgi:RNA polymerase sigma factor (TIGR02999 family)
VTELIDAANRGDDAAMQALFTRVYGELKQLARRQLAASAHPTLNTTGLVHEAYMRLAQPQAGSLHGRAHFFALAAKAMRQIVIDHARARTADKRGGRHLEVLQLDEAASLADGGLGPYDLLRLDRALTELEQDDARLARLVELRFFAGLPIADIAVLQQVSERTLERDWRRAKALLHAVLYPEA